MSVATKRLVAIARIVAVLKTAFLTVRPVLYLLPALFVAHIAIRAIMSAAPKIAPKWAILAV
ncbi:MAG: hypothetical protein COT34_01690 [Candidatus Nealsonbacteria bacterium CG08_land_8_20_14_0_20_43_11]|uniref:Uncharacterized protein n=1 Tax=Candidatus Nealsonbacteria bacterium CG08_land_8_20_14_0_20_43_11 TaxID=1974706 RepID=A0A2M6T0P9_9BACT|nr:MAG: hypothetical protein COT34_01690 [Candidatus Nealsonbacteria bacterium CG08_land_8_20_14_0_20_43_11]